jgi:hypothetical protein
MEGSMNVSPRSAFFAIAASVVVGVLLPFPSDVQAPGTVHALSVNAADLSGPCAGFPVLDAATLSFIFAPALDAPVETGDGGDGVGKAASPVTVIDERTFTVDGGGGAYTVRLDTDNVPIVNGPDGLSSAMLRRDVAVCVGIEAAGANPPGQWTADGLYVVSAGTMPGGEPSGVDR